MHESIIHSLLPDFNMQLQFVLRLAIACVCGAAIGIERYRRQKEAGLRTHVIVTLGSCLATIVSKYGFFDVVINESMQVDVSRISSNILPSIAFLGAGMIFTKNGGIKGLTTAAGIWATAAVGIAIGSGLFLVGISATVLIVIIHIIFHQLYDNGSITTIHLRYAKDEEIPDNIKEDIERRFRCKVNSIDAKRSGSGSIHVTLEVRTRGRKNYDVFTLDLLKDPHFLGIDM